MASFVSTAGAATGTTAAFYLGTEGAQLAGEALVAVRQVPWGPDVVVDLGGPGAQRLRGTVWVSSTAQAANLQTLRGDAGTLVWAGSTGQTAVLLSVNAKNWSDRQYFQLADVEFLLL